MLEQIRATVRRIPKGSVATYGDVARAAGYPGAARQVVWALRNCGPGVPWHRVVGAGGRILLPGEAGLDQELRLRQEGVEVGGSRVALDAHRHDFRVPPVRKSASTRVAPAVGSRPTKYSRSSGTRRNYPGGRSSSD